MDFLGYKSWQFKCEKNSIRAAECSREGRGGEGGTKIAPPCKEKKLRDFSSLTKKL